MKNKPTPHTNGRAILPIKKEDLAKFIGLKNSGPRITDRNQSQQVRYLSETSFKSSHVLYEIEYLSNGDWVPAFILFPLHSLVLTQKGKTPAVVVCHTHGSNWEFGSNEMVGQVGDQQEALALDLVRKGYLVIAPDMIGFGKRIKISPQEQNEGMQGCVGYSNFIAALNLAGDNYLRHAVQDIVRAIDVLETYPEVNKSRIGLVGYSFGGHIVSKAAIFDQRAYATVAIGAIGTIAKKIESKLKIDPTENVAGLLSLGDTQDFLKLIAPRAMLISSSINDKYAIDSKKVYEAIKPSWDELDASDNLKLLNHYRAEHRLIEKMKLDAYRWLDEKMKS